MELEWKHSVGNDVDLFNDGKFVAWVDGDVRPYRVQITYTLAGDMMPCENAEYVTLRQAMRALRETVTILLIGESYGSN